ncbi:hypothetical protein BDP27DRAFT_1361402 [Rhodocollybia butyracea]|uniref:Uncharacterized protein n=1 Tax=Rhodocollybia butyracea TaxID=206335 RepID=A0A9P5PXZ7_9AGAR|nr:hypothetical protein BDP27DRAFT_1361402 [Rhodocollybia butyracea]
MGYKDSRYAVRCKVWAAAHGLVGSSETNSRTYEELELESDAATRYGVCRRGFWIGSREEGGNCGRRCREGVNGVTHVRGAQEMGPGGQERPVWLSSTVINITCVPRIFGIDIGISLIFIEGFAIVEFHVERVTHGASRDKLGDFVTGEDSRAKEIFLESRLSGRLDKTTTVRILIIQYNNRYLLISISIPHPLLKARASRQIQTAPPRLYGIEHIRECQTNLGQMKRTYVV